MTSALIAKQVTEELIELHRRLEEAENVIEFYATIGPVQFDDDGGKQAQTYREKYALG